MKAVWSKKLAVGVAAAGALALAGCTAVTTPATNIGTTTATLNAHGECSAGESLSGTYRFQWREKGESGWPNQNGTTNYSCPAGGDSQDKSYNATGLSKYTDYQYRLKLVVNGVTYYCDSTSCANTDGSGTWTTFRTTSGTYLDSASPWKQDISGSVTLDGHSNDWANAIYTIANADYDSPGSFYNRGDWNNVQYDQSQNNGVPRYVARPTDPVKTITLTTTQPTSEQTLVTNIHIPGGATPAPGSDSPISIWYPHDDLIVSCWAATYTPGTDSYTAQRCTGTSHAHDADGISGTGDHPSFSCGPPPAPCWGDSGTGLPLSAGAITSGDLSAAESGGTAHAIGHALALSLPSVSRIDANGVAEHIDTQHPCDPNHPCYGNNNGIDLSAATGDQEFVYPAQEHDGNCSYSAANCVPEGAKIRVAPSFNCTSGTGTGGHPNTLFGQVLCLTLQKYGAIDRDSNGGAVSFYTASNQDLDSGCPNGNPCYIQSTDWSTVMDPNHFPWANLEVVEANKCSARPCNP